MKEERGSWGKAPYLVLPNTDHTNEVAKELGAVAQKTKSIQFVHCGVEKFVPEWHDMRNHKEGFLLQPAVLMPSLMLWAMAAQVMVFIIDLYAHAFASLTLTLFTFRLTSAVGS